MNVGELLKERDRLLGVLEEAKVARPKLRQLNTLIAMYGDADNVSKNGHVPVPVDGTGKKKTLYCGKCDAGPFAPQGIGVHNFRIHGGKVKVAE